eukprot:s416_g18.t1
MAVGNPGKARLNIGQRFLQTPEGRLYRAAKDGDIEGVAAACAEGAKLDVPHPEHCWRFVCVNSAGCGVVIGFLHHEF